MAHSKNTTPVTRFCPPPLVVQEFCLEEMFPQFLFRYKSPPQQMPLSEKESLQLCQMVHTFSPSNFILQLDADRRTCDRLSSDMSALYGSERRAEFVVTEQFLHPGVPVAARYLCGNDLRWYRAIIVEIDPTPGKEKPIRIRFVDYGNFQQNDPIEVKMLPKDMGNEPPMAIKSRLEGTVEGEDYEQPIKAQFLTWTNETLKDERVLAHFNSFDAAANQYVVKLFNANTGDQFVLPPGGRIQPAATTENTVDDLINLDENDDGDGIESTAATVPTPTPPNVSVFVQELNTVFASMAVTDSGIAGVDGEEEQDEEEKPKPETTDSETQTDVTIQMLKEAEEAEEVEEEEESEDELETGGEASGDSVPPPYNPYNDPRFKEMIDKYPNVFAYMQLKDGAGK